MRAEKDLRKMATVAMLAAVSIVLGKYLAITIGPLRLSLENLPVLLAGVVLGPVAGAVTGVLADVIGCVLVGYTINPLITLGAGLIGFTAGMVYRTRIPSLINWGDNGRLILAVIAAHLVGSCVVKSLGLWIYYNYPMSLLLLRLPLYAAIGLCEYFILKPIVKLLRKNF